MKKEKESPSKLGKKGFWYWFLHDPKAMIGLIFVTVEILLVIILPIVQELNPDMVYADAAGKSPELSGHILGLTDAYQDVYARLLYGGRISLIIGIGSTLIGLLIGVPIGLIAGYYGGKVDSVLMRIAEVFISFPSMVLMLVMVAILGANIGIVAVLLGFLGWPSAAKLIESNVRSVSKKEYVEAARALGKSDLKIMFQDIMPNVLGPVLVTIPFRVSSGILSEASLSFLGVGIENSWGKTINCALSSFVMQKETWIWVPASVLLVATIIAINLLGEGIRDAFDPKMAR
jgi:peptide/nickel transport system permease protein